MALSFLLLMSIIGVALYLPPGFGQSVTLPISRTKTAPSETQPPKRIQHHHQQEKPHQQAPPPTIVNADDPNWKYDAEKHERRFGLSFAQCNSAFAGLYTDLESTMSHRKSLGDVTEEELDLKWKKDGAVRAMIHNQKLHIIETKFAPGGYNQERGLAILHSIDRAISSSSETIPDIEFSFSVSDIADTTHSDHTIWALSRLAIDAKTWLMPDFGFWSWPLQLVGGYEEIRAEIHENEVPWDDKIAKVLWRGAAKTNKVRSDLLKVTRNKDWADVHDMHWKNRTDVGNGEKVIPIVDHCNYQYLIHTEGRSYSGRGKYLLNCRSVSFIHKREWIEPHHAALISSGPEQNFVEVERDFSDLEAKVKELINDPERAITIANNSAATFRDRFLTPAAQACYWRQLFKSWAEVSFTPEGWEIVDGKRKVRGVPFESFVIQMLTPPETNCPLWKKLLLQC